jgi:hypothetical protein
MPTSFGDSVIRTQCVAGELGDVCIADVGQRRFAARVLVEHCDGEPLIFRCRLAACTCLATRTECSIKRLDALPGGL